MCAGQMAHLGHLMTAVMSCRLWWGGWMHRKPCARRTWTTCCAMAPTSCLPRKLPRKLPARLMVGAISLMALCVWDLALLVGLLVSCWAELLGDRGRVTDVVEVESVSSTTCRQLVLRRNHQLAGRVISGSAKHSPEWGSSLRACLLTPAAGVKPSLPSLTCLDPYTTVHSMGGHIHPTHQMVCDHLRCMQQAQRLRGQRQLQLGGTLGFPRGLRPVPRALPGCPPG